MTDSRDISFKKRGTARPHLFLQSTGEQIPPGLDTNPERGLLHIPLSLHSTSQPRPGLKASDPRIPNLTSLTTLPITRSPPNAATFTHVPRTHHT